MRSYLSYKKLLNFLRYQGGVAPGIRALAAVSEPERTESPKPDSRATLTNFDASAISKKLETGGWEVCLSENSDSENEGDTPKVKFTSVYVPND
jgi:hypothetical protein